MTPAKMKAKWGFGLTTGQIYNVFILNPNNSPGTQIGRYDIKVLFYGDHGQWEITEIDRFTPIDNRDLMKDALGL